MFFNALFTLRPNRRPWAVPGGAPPGTALRSPWLNGAIILIITGAVAWAVFSPRYYAWVLGNTPINLVVFCNTAELADPGLQAVVLYDQLALHPLTRALGLCQNRPPEEVRVFFPRPIRRYILTPFSITLQDVPWGPISRIVFSAHGRHYTINVPDRRLVKGVLYVRVPS